ncbi:MAG TPA: hypothetical protein VNZ03_26220 [Terriglobales bacterium]|nr:hypothetical protein [Terriglobales bacterium]
MDGAKTNATVMAAPTVPMSGIWRTIRDYIFWSYERGTIQYDVMVTLILVFVFLSPKLINFKDKPVEHNPHRTGVAVVPDGQGGLIYQIEAAAVTSQDDGAVRSQLLDIIEPISGEVNITKVEPIRDGSGHVLSYKVWVARE